MYEELIAALNAADKRPCSDLECPGSGECPTVGCLFREAADAIEELSASVAGYEMTTDVEFVKEDGHERIRFVPKWVSVNERLPEKNGEFLVCGRWRGKPIKIWVCERVKLGPIMGWANPAENPVISHWMPLPQPPKEETE